MIAIENKIVGVAPTEILGASLTAIAERNKRDRPANLVLKFEGGEVHEASFTKIRFDAESNQLMPLLEVGQWENIVLVMGWKKWLIFSVTPVTQIGSLDLHRSENEDAGFYRVNFLSQNGLLIAVYESGVAAISGAGKVVWHRKKYWDDVLLQANDGRLIFLTESGQRFAFECSSGEDTEAN